jgi:hypothetical protein
MPRSLFPSIRAVRLFSLLALVAMSVRVVVPAGFMLVADPDRWVTMTVCAGTGPMQLSVNLSTGEHRAADDSGHDDPKPSAHHAPCLFAATAPLAALPLFCVDVGPAVKVEAPTLIFPYEVAVGRGLAAPPPWATGPPLTLWSDLRVSGHRLRMTSRVKPRN